MFVAHLCEKCVSMEVVAAGWPFKGPCNTLNVVRKRCQSVVEASQNTSGKYYTAAHRPKLTINSKCQLKIAFSWQMMLQAQKSLHLWRSISYWLIWAWCTWLLLGLLRLVHTCACDCTEKPCIRRKKKEIRKKCSRFWGMRDVFSSPTPALLA